MFPISSEIQNSEILHLYTYLCLNSKKRKIPFLRQRTEHWLADRLLLRRQAIHAQGGGRSHPPRRLRVGSLPGGANVVSRVTERVGSALSPVCLRR